MPERNEFDIYKRIISEKYPSLSGVYGIADGLKLYLKQEGNCVIQKMFYNGWKCDQYIENVLDFAPSGLIFAAIINAPGCMHESKFSEWGKLYEKLEKFYNETGGKIVVDSEFDRSRYPFLINSAQDETKAEGSEKVNVIRHATSCRQAAEWGIEMFQGSFPWMNDRFIYEENVRNKESTFKKSYAWRHHCTLA